MELVGWGSCGFLGGEEVWGGGLAEIERGIALRGEFGCFALADWGIVQVLVDFRLGFRIFVFLAEF